MLKGIINHRPLARALRSKGRCVTALVLVAAALSACVGSVNPDEYPASLDGGAPGAESPLTYGDSGADHNSGTDVSATPTSASGVNSSSPDEAPAANSSADAPKEPSPEVTSCVASSRGLSEINVRRLTTPELVSALRAFFGPAMDADSVRSSLGSLRSESPISLEVTFDNRIVDVEGLEVVARAIGGSVVANEATSRAVLGCDIEEDVDSCHQAFLKNFLPRLFRRPIGDEERESYESFIEDIGGGRDGLEWALARAILSPHFHQHLELLATPTGDGRLRLDSSAVAARLAFRLTGAPPDDELLSDPEATASLSGLRKHAERLIHSPAGREQVRQLFRTWLAIDPPDPSAMLAGKAELTPDGLGAEVAEEFDRYVEYMLFEKGASFRELVDSQMVFPFSERLAQLYGVEVSEEPVDVPNGPRGLFMRAASLITGQAETNPIVRGATFRRRVLCEMFPTPDPLLVQAGQAVAESLSRTEYSQRIRASAATAGAGCAGCHERINSVGFVLEQFGPLGEWRETQRVFDEKGELLAEFPIDATAPHLGLSVRAQVDGAADLNQQLASSSEVNNCFAQWSFALARQRFPTPADTCAIGDVVQANVEELPVLDVLVTSVVNDDIFYRAENSQ